MKQHLNTLFVTLEGAYLRKDGAAVDVRHEGKSKLRVPLHNLDGIACFGWDCCATASLMAACAENAVALSFHTPHGKFISASQSFTSGNILLRREQYRRADDPAGSLAIAANIVAAKIANSRATLQRAARDHGSKDGARSEALRDASAFLQPRIRRSAHAADLDALRGIEGDVAAAYFGAFNSMITSPDAKMKLLGRSRRPPLDPVNALLSFAYTLLMHDCRSALEGCGLDAQCGFLHRDRPGRPSLALDLMEEMRSYLADRLALSLMNRKQIVSKHFEHQESGAVFLREEARKTVILAWQERKKDQIEHPFLGEKITIGLLPHIQARLLARHLRGDIDAYPAFLSR